MKLKKGQVVHYKGKKFKGEIPDAIANELKLGKKFKPEEAKAEEPKPNKANK